MSKNYLDSQLRKQQIQDSIVNEYSLETRLLPSSVANRVVYDMFLANRIFVTDYNLLNEDVQDCKKTYNDVELYPDEIEAPKFFSGITRRIYNFKFVEKQQNTRKRNY